MRVLSLFSGGGLGDLGLHKCGMKTTAFVEKNWFCRKILRLRFPNTIMISDIKTLNAILSWAVSHAKTSRLLTRMTEKELRAKDQAYGLKCSKPYAFYDPNTSSWKTYQHSLWGGLEPFSGTWPRSGMMRNGHVYKHINFPPTTKEIGCSLLPTPQASDGLRLRFSVENLQNARRKHREKGTFLGSYLAETLAEDYGLSQSVQLTEKLMNVPYGWTDLNCSETASTLIASSGSGNK